MMKRVSRKLLLLVSVLLLTAAFGLNSEAASLNKKNLNLRTGQTYMLKVKGTKKTVKWKSANKKIARVSKKGKVTARRSGTTTITAKYRNRQLQCKVTVLKPLKHYAHRGYSRKYPENSLPAFKGAMAAGYDGIEFDMFETKSGDLLVFHDRTLERMCGTDEDIFSITAKSRYKYPMIGGYNIHQYKDLVMPTFEETIKAMQKKGAKLQIHLKAPDSYTDAGIAKINRVLRKYGMLEDSVVFCNNIKLLQKLQKQGVPVGILTTADSAKAIEQRMEVCIENEFASFNVFRPAKVTKEIVNKCHENGIEIGAYWVRTKEEVERLDRLGVDFIYSDWPMF